MGGLDILLCYMSSVDPKKSKGALTCREYGIINDALDITSTSDRA